MRTILLMAVLVAAVPVMAQTASEQTSPAQTSPVQTSAASFSTERIAQATVSPGGQSEASGAPTHPAPGSENAQTSSQSPAPGAGTEAMSEAETHRLKTLSAELRCLVCQNQSLADSNAELAVDLRNQVRDQIRAGKSDGEIKDYLVQRYGEFVLYRPRMSALTGLLWVGPFLLLAVGGAAMAIYLRRRQRAGGEAPATPDRLEEARALLREDASQSTPGAERPS